MKNIKIYLFLALGILIGAVLGYFLAPALHSTKVENNTNNTNTAAEETIYTCSMHPQIRQNEEGDCPICGMDLIPAEQGGSANSLGFEMTAEAVKLANIQTTIIGNSSRAKGGLHLNGRIKADETQAASLVSHIPGRIEKLYVSFTGEKVRKGQKIATIYSPDLITAQKELIEAQKIADISPGLLEAARNKMKYWKISPSIIEGILSSGKVKENFDIYAEHSGIVSKRRATVGDHLATGEVLFDVQNLSRVWALFEVYEKDLSKVRIGSKIVFETPSVLNKTFRATISFVEPVINPKTRVATIRAEVSNLGQLLKPEMFVSGSISTSSKTSVLSVPKTAVLWTGKRSVVYVKIPNTAIPSFDYREIELGESLGKSYIVSSGLEDGEEVVTNGAFVIDASAQLNNQTSMMNKKVKIKGASAQKLPNFKKTTAAAFQKQLGQLVLVYLDLKNALVATDSKEGAVAALQFVAALAEMDMALLQGDAHDYWMEQLEALEVHTNLLAEAKEIEEQRSQFKYLSEALIRATKVFGLQKNIFYVQFCPMANNDEGADWLSKNKEIRNPYFGDQMLQCGSVQDSIY